MSINATVQKLVDDLFADQLVKGLKATENISWLIKDKTSYDPLTGEVVNNESQMEIPVIVGAGDLKQTDERSLAADDDMVIQMQPINGRTSKEALADSFYHEDREYAVKKIEVVRLGGKPMLWKVMAS
jgi:hypothetical protein